MEEAASGAAKVMTSHLLEQGMLGLLCLVAMLAACFFYWEKRKGESRERELYERHAAKSEKWNEKHYEHVRDMRELIASLVSLVRKG